MAVITVQGADKVITELTIYANPTLIYEALKKSAYLVENAAKRKCPVDTGRLRASITNKVDMESLEATIGTNVLYAPYVEYGTGLFSSKGNGRKDRWSYQRADGTWVSTLGNKPQPFLVPALNECRQQIIRYIKEADNV